MDGLRNGDHLKSELNDFITIYCQYVHYKYKVETNHTQVNKKVEKWQNNR